MKHISNFSNFNFSENSISENKVNEELIPSTNVRSELIKLVGDGNVDAIDRFMDKNNIDVDYDSGMLSKLAAKQGKMELIKYFDEIGANFSIRRNLIVKTALAHGNSEIAKYILDQLDLDSEQISDIEEYVVSSETVDVREKKAAIDILNKYK